MSLPIYLRAFIEKRNLARAERDELTLVDRFLNATRHAETSEPSRILSKCGDGPTGAAGHQGLLDAQGGKGGVGSASGAGQINTSTGIASPTPWVVVRKSVYPALVLLGLRLRLLGLKAKVCVLALKRPNPFSQKFQVLAEHRRRCVLVEQRLHFVEQRLQHFFSLGFTKCHRSAGGAA